MEEDLNVEDAFVKQVQLALQMQGFTGLDNSTVERIIITCDQTKAHRQNFSIRHVEKIDIHLSKKYPPQPQQKQ